jgi:hypothetical protein
VASVDAELCRLSVHCGRGGGAFISDIGLLNRYPRPGLCSTLSFRFALHDAGGLRGQHRVGRHQLQERRDGALRPTIVAFRAILR